MPAKPKAKAKPKTETAPKVTAGVLSPAQELLCAAGLELGATAKVWTRQGPTDVTITKAVGVWLVCEAPSGKKLINVGAIREFDPGENPPAPEDE